VNRRFRSVALYSAGIALAFLISGCGNADDFDGPEAPPSYQNPVVLTEGDYFPEYLPYIRSGPTSADSALRAESSVDAFEGEVNGIRLYSQERAFYGLSEDKKGCPVQEYSIGDVVTFGYLPGGTFAAGPQYSAICEDGSVGWTTQNFDTKHGTFTVVYDHLEPAFAHRAPHTRVESRTLRGHPGVIIEPPGEGIFGRSNVAVVVPGGMLLLDAFDLPLAESLKIIEGIECDGC
jgi:hypothetical protein